MIAEFVLRIQKSLSNITAYDPNRMGSPWAEDR